MSKITVSTKFAYGLGQIGEQVKSQGFNTFLFFFFTQVLGLSGTLAGTAVLIALVFDAITDPIAGSLSDNFKSKYGRRHPFMYAAAVPLAIFWFIRAFVRAEGGIEDAIVVVVLIGTSVFVLEAVAVFWFVRAFVRAKRRLENPVLIVVCVRTSIFIHELITIFRFIGALIGAVADAVTISVAAFAAVIRPSEGQQDPSVWRADRSNDAGSTSEADNETVTR